MADNDSDLKLDPLNPPKYCPHCAKRGLKTKVKKFKLDPNKDDLTIMCKNAECPWPFSVVVEPKDATVKEELVRGKSKKRQAGTSVSRLAALHLRRDKDADFTLSCQGTTIPAHTLVLAFQSEYFEMALSKDWLEKKERRMELKECSAEALHVAVNFMYGMNVPEDFKEHGELLHLAELFMMDNLKEVIEERLAKSLTKLNYLEIGQMAEVYSITSLITKCGHFVFEEFGDGAEINWEEMEKLPKVMTAFGKRSMKGKEDKKVFKKFRLADHCPPA